MIMEKYFVADSYKDFQYDVNKAYENSKGKLVVNATCKCDRCSGRGLFATGVRNMELVISPVDGGVCYKCNGTGIEEKTSRLYTEKEKAAMDRATENRRKAKEKKDAERIAKNEADSEINKAEWLTKNCFSADGFTYCVCGDDTYAIKDKLKEMGCRFDPILKWHCDKEIELPEGYSLLPIAFDEIMKWEPQLKNAFYLEEAKATVERKMREAAGPSLSQYVGEVGERLRNITAVYKSQRGFAGAYGWTNIFTFESGDDVLVWFTATDLDLEVGQTVDLSGTVKKHEEFRGVKTTQLSRCKITVIGE
jgi:hypothetical protein